MKWPRMGMDICEQRNAQGIIVRLSNKVDLAAIIALEQACFTIDHRFNKRQLNYLITKAKAINFVAMLEHKLCGYCISLIRNNVLLRLYSIAVDPLHAGTGVG